MHLTTPIARCGPTASTAHAAPEQTSRRIGLGLRTHSRRHSATTTPTALVQRGTYNWRGQRYEIDEDTLPEWLEAATTRKRRAPNPHSADELREAMAATAPRLIVKLPISLIVRPASQLIVKLPLGFPAARALQRSIANSAETSSSVSADSSMAMDIDVCTPAGPQSGSSSELPSETGMALAPCKLLLNPPYVAEPDHSMSLWLGGGALSETVAQTEARQAFYGSHMFLCSFHTPITKFLLQLDSRYLKCLKPGSVRLTTKLAHMGFVHRGLKDFNQRGPDGLRTDVAVMPITVENEEDDVWVSLANVDDFDGVTSGSAAGQGKVAKRKPAVRWSFDSDDDELYT